ncbi:MAG: hypothetical protein CNCCGFBP_00760 [Fimbriimonadaceae bacterium]|nr:hypothetical protein [Fimbriimonadaceae bacterium]
MTWSFVPIGTAARVVSGATPSTSCPEYWGGSICWATPKDISELNGSKFLDDTPRKLTEAGLRSCSAEVLPPNSVLFSSRAPIGLVAINRVPTATNQGFKSFVPDPSKLDTGYLFHWLRAHRAQIERMGVGATFSEVSKAIVSRIEIPLPPLDEQRRIAAMLDKAEELRAKRRAAIALLDQLPQAIFLEMFGDPVTNPKNWHVRTIEETTECLDRFRKPVKASDRPDGPIPYYGANGLQGWIDRALFNESLVLVAEDGGHFENPTRGVAYRIDGPAWVNNHAHILRAKAKVLDVEFLHRVLRHYSFVPFISGTTRSKLTQGQLAKATIPVPPIDLQRRFAASVESTNRAKAAYQSALAESDTLFASIQSRVFAGDRR